VFIAHAQSDERKPLVIWSCCTAIGLVQVVSPIYPDNFCLVDILNLHVKCIATSGAEPEIC
jgi:hypothetical protein